MVVSRRESAAATRRDLIDTAAQLLDAGGPEAVTLREVGARAGVSRGAPYRHFAGKEELLTAVAAEGWQRTAARLGDIRSTSASHVERLEAALTALIDLGRTQPHLYRTMFTAPQTDPEAAARAATDAQQQFLGLVADVVGTSQAHRYGAILLTSAHGIATLEHSGHLTDEKWHTTTGQLVHTLVTMAAADAK